MQSVSISSRQSDNRRIQEEKRYTRCSQSGILFFPPNYCGSILRFNRNNTGADRNWQAQKKTVHVFYFSFSLFTLEWLINHVKATVPSRVKTWRRRFHSPIWPVDTQRCNQSRWKLFISKRALTRAILLQLSESYILRNRNKFNRSDKRKKKYSLLATHDKDRAIATLVFVRCSSFIPSPKYGRQGNKSDATCTQSSSFSSIQSPFF